MQDLMMQKADVNRPHFRFRANGILTTAPNEMNAATITSEKLHINSVKPEIARSLNEHFPGKKSSFIIKDAAIIIGTVNDA